MDVALPKLQGTRRAPDEVPGHDDLTGHARLLVDRNGPRRTQIRMAGVWAHVDQPGGRLPEQGWKLHISATESSAHDVLSAVVPVLLRHGASFKFAADRGVVRLLNSATVDRGSGGKFLTVYPADDDAARLLAAACHEATETLHGPVILSDRPYRPGSLVHYRYGGFSDRHAIDADGLVVYLIRDPDGNLIADERRPGRWGPAWAVDPFQPAGPAPAPAGAGPITLAGRYVVRAALRHANKGGVYLAEDQLRGVPVVVKEGRPHVAGSSVGDARSRIRHEASILARLQGTGCVPGFVDLFDAGGHTFLVTEHIDAPTLRDQIDDAGYPPEGGLAAPEVAGLAVRLAAAMAAAHSAGVVLRDFNPNNVLVGDDGAITLIDFEFAHLAGSEPEAASGTPGYSAPEEMRGEPSGFAGDCWSLGATIAFVATGADPYFPSDSARPWSDPARLRAWLHRLIETSRVDPRIAELILACMGTDPQHRHGPDAVVPALTAEPAGEPPAPLPSLVAAATRPIPDPSEVTAWLLSTMGTGTSGHVWPAGPTGMPLDPANVQSGASGVGLYLCRAATAPGSATATATATATAAGRDGARLRAAVAATAAWVSDRIARGPDRPPGLHFGLSGMVWFLTEASATLGRDDLARRASELALSLPARSLNPDVSHGTAGIGMAQLHQWLRTGDERFAARAVLAAEHLARTVAGDGTWSVPGGAPTRLAGTTSYGFAHGSAGIGTFLVYAGAATGEARFTDLGLDVIAGLVEHAVVADDGAAYWPVGPDNDELWPHWCNGSTGVGTALVRAWAVSGDRRLLGAAEAAALAGIRETWRSSTVQCHGLAGDAELLLDLVSFAPDAGCARRWQAAASEAGASLWVRRRRDGGHLTFADDTGGSVSAGFGTGMAGVGAFLLRLADGGPRLLMLDELLPGAGT